MKKKLLLILRISLVLVLSQSVFCQTKIRKEINLPEIPNYKILKCDFHIHTVFSDGSVWPDVRAKEAWLEGLDSIALTDHLEYTPNKNDIKMNFNRPYEIASPEAGSLGITLIKGAEITRDMPPGHLNAIFLKDVEPLKTEKWEDSVKKAKEQDAFIFWNHPGWKRQQPDGIAKCYDEHETLYKNKCLNGMEVANTNSYFPEVHRWCLEKNVTMLANTDLHEPAGMIFDFAKGGHRPMTLVLAKENTSEAIKEALFDCRTVIYKDNMLIGKKEYILPIFENSILIKNKPISLVGEEKTALQIYNSSEINYDLVLDKKTSDLTSPQTITLNAQRTVILNVGAKSANIKGEKECELNYIVKNLLIAPDEGLPVTIKIKVKFE